MPPCTAPIEYRLLFDSEPTHSRRVVRFKLRRSGNCIVLEAQDWTQHEDDWWAVMEIRPEGLCLFPGIRPREGEPFALDSRGRIVIQDP